LKTGRSAIGLLRLLLAATVVIPLLLFVGASWLDYRAAFGEAERDLQHISQVGREHAEKVFDGQNQVIERVADLVRGMAEPEIIRAEKTLHDEFARIVAHLAEVQSVLLAGADGRPLVSAGTYPVPVVDLSKRDYFRAVIGGHTGPYVSSLQVGEVNKQLFFGLARPWIGSDGKLAGVIDVAVSPTFFRDFYGALMDQGPDTIEGNTVTLVRDDGQWLARYPPIEGPPPMAPPGGPFLEAIRTSPDEGIFESRLIVDPSGPGYVFAYNKVDGYPLYVVAGRNRDNIIAAWRRSVESHLVFGVPATVALVAVAWTALVRTRREEAALARANQENEKRRAAEEALLRSQRLEAVGQMTGGVAHDFNNLLTIIMGGAHLLMRRADDPASVRRVAEQIMLAARRGGEVTQQLLAFARRQFVKPETVNLNRRLLEFEELLRRAAREAVQVEFDLDPALDTVRLDPGHFEAAILNLVGNARDAMPDGGRVVIATRNIRLTDPTRSDLPPGAYVRVAVTDNGSGMDPETVSKAFEPFFTTKEIGKGSGLGLSQVYGFAKQAGGDARITSTPGQGTTVEILLPRSTLPRSTLPGSTLPGSTGRETAERPSLDSVPLRDANAGEVVLVVEDEPALLAMTVGSLHELGYATLGADTAQAALDILRGDQRVDVLFSDVVMPGGMNGAQLSVEARRLRPALKVLLTSGYTGGLDADDGSDVPVLTKPYDRGQLARQMRAVLQG
jgi:two-component system NtrC family sensor kinase